jgi:hypothetical protein
MGNFAKDLAFGRKYEGIAKTMLNEVLVDEPKGCFSAYDFKTEKAKYEIKSDLYTHRTGNLFIEFECSGKPSGITTTASDYYIYFVVKGDGFDAYKIPIDVLREACKKPKAIKAGGDGWKSRGFLIDVQLFGGYRL